MQRADVTADLARAVERRARPRMWEVAPLGERAAGASEAIDRPAGLAAAKRRRARPPQRAAQTFRRILQRLLQPRAERAGIEAVRLRFGQDREKRIDARFHGPLA